ncbi:MAG: rane protein [Symbiobacteriaceae bacterium]|nr:rane protein [Symbiobacteriaceae bacterium]
MATTTANNAATFRTRLPGVVLTAGLATVAYLAGTQVPIIGGPVFGILLGMLVQALGFVKASHKPGIMFSSKQILQLSIILLGAGLSLTQIITTGASSLAVMLSTMATCLLAAWGLGRVLKVSGNLTTLIGVGTAICGASAIAAVTPVVEAEEQDVAYAISTIFLFNMLAVLIFPPLGHMLGLSQDSFGLWAGTAINDTSSVVAAAYSYGQEAGSFATVVKLTRSTLIIPIALSIAAFRAAQTRRAGDGAAKVKVSRLIPWFIIWFLVAALVNTLGVIPTPVVKGATVTAKFLIVVALTAVGLSANFRQMAKTGFKPILMGMALWATVALTSLLVQRLTGQL